MRCLTLVPLFLFFLCFATDLVAKTNKYRIMWREDPATTMTIGWNQISGTASTVFYDTNDHGKDVLAYSYSILPEAQNNSKGMQNTFARLIDLLPGTLYYFVIQDSEGCSERMSFRTAPDNPYERLSIIAGGDSRNYRDARQKANSLVAKLQPHCVLFGGDMTGGDNARQWNAWFEDWQLTITPEGHLTPIIITRGNHEYSNKTLTDLFDVASKDAYYALSLGGNLLRVYTLNSLIPSGGNQKAWLEKDLQKSQDHNWRIAQYHFAIRPHTAKKSERNNQLRDWAPLFEKYKVKMAVESDAHCVKWTYPIRPSREQGSDEGFIRDDVLGTVYVGEGCWGAPLRRNNDDKKWTRNSGSFNQFKWIFIDQDRIEVRTVKTDFVEEVATVDPYDKFSPPSGLELWEPSNGSVVVIENQFNQYAQFVDNGASPPMGASMTLLGFEVKANKEGVKVKWHTENECEPAQAFNIQKSEGGQSFLTIKTIQSKGMGNHSYDFFDVYYNSRVDQEEFGVTNENSFAKIVYRLQAQLPDGSVNTYSAKPALWSVEEGVAPRSDQRSIVDHAQQGNNKDQRINLKNEDVTTTDEVQTNPDQFKRMNKLIPISSGLVQAKYKVMKSANVEIKLVDRAQKVLSQSAYKNLNSGNYLQSIDMNPFPQGQYMLMIEANDEVIQQYLVVK